ncbi:hypothetical protein D9M70_615530 [compost metagenome]
MVADGGHRVNLQPAHRRDVSGSCLLIGFTHLFKNFLAALQVAHTGFGQCQAPSGAVDQACLKPGLQTGHRFGNIRRGGVQHLRRRCKTAGLGDSHEKTHGLENIHR